MGVNMKKGSNVSLETVAAAAEVVLRHVVVACGWNPNPRVGPNFDLDLSAAGLDGSGRLPAVYDSSDPGRQNWFINANHRNDSIRCIVFGGDNRTGEGGGDDEVIGVDLDKVPAEIERIVFQVVVYRAEERRQKFGDVEEAFIRIYDAATGTEFARFNLDAEFSDETLVIFGELYRYGGKWKFRAVGQGYDAADFRTLHGIEHPFETEYARPNYY